MTPTQTLHGLLTRLGAVPDGLETDTSGMDGRDLWAIGGMKVPEGVALGLLCNAARRVCDSEMVSFRECLPHHDFIVSDRFNKAIAGLNKSLDYESALIAGLEWIIQQREAK